MPPLACYMGPSDGMFLLARYAPTRRRRHASPPAGRGAEPRPPATQNDVPEGGATRFTDLPSGPVTFQPQKGKAILWPSVLADQPFTIDPRTHHEALPVTKGEKVRVRYIRYIRYIRYMSHPARAHATGAATQAYYPSVRLPQNTRLGPAQFGANFWIHQHDFKGAHATGCTAG